MKKQYQKAVITELELTKNAKIELLEQKDIAHLPEMVQRYLHYVNVVGKEKVRNFRAEFLGGIRSSSTDAYMPLKSVQYNFIENPTRIFYIVAKKKGIPAKGLHLYKDEQAIMKVKIFGLFTTDGKIYKNYPWLTPVVSYTDINGYRLPSGAKLIYKHPSEDFCYGEFNLVNIEYNCKTLK